MATHSRSHTCVLCHPPGDCVSGVLRLHGESTHLLALPLSRRHLDIVNPLSAPNTLSLALRTCWCNTAPTFLPVTMACQCPAASDPEPTACLGVNVRASDGSVSAFCAALTKDLSRLPYKGRGFVEITAGEAENPAPCLCLP